MQLYEQTITDLQSKIANKDLSCVEIAREYQKRIEETNDKTNTFLETTFENAQKTAEALDEKIAKGESVSSLAGIPYALKDNICTKDIRTTCSSQLLKNFVPPYSAHVYENLIKSDAVLMGKVDMDEFAMGSTNENSSFHPVHNPYNTDCVPGGSSGASAASVAAGQVPFALGSDTGGSVRTPAAFCSVTGFKPTYGTVSRYGLVAFASSLDQIGTLTKSAEDAALVMNVISGYDRRDSTSLNREAFDYTSFLEKGLEGFKIGVDKTNVEEGVDKEIVDNYLQTIDTFKKLGAEIVDINFKMLEYAVPVYYLVACSEASSNLARFDGIRYGERVEGESLEDLFVLSRSKGFGDEVKRRIMLGTYALSAGYYDMYYNKALKLRRLIKEDFYDALDKCDVYLGPTTATPAFKIGEKTDDVLSLYKSDIFTVTANLTGIPAMSIPTGFTKSGLPIGMQLSAKGLQEEKIFRAAYNFQMNTDFHKTNPTL